jgi:hypothetical protein
MPGVLDASPSPSTLYRARAGNAEAEEVKEQRGGTPQTTASLVKLRAPLSLFFFIVSFLFLPLSETRFNGLNSSYKRV